MIAFAVESWEAVREEIQPLWRAHYEEIAADKDKIPLDPDMAKYQAHADAGRLHIVAAREKGALAGYALVLVDTNLHYKSTLFGTFDIHYLRPGCRKGMAGAKLFRFAEDSLKARGVQKMAAATKVWLDTGPLFERLGWRETERLYTKWIG